MKAQILEVVRKTVKIEIDVTAGSKFLLAEYIEPKLEKFVQKSSTPFDNIMKATLMPEVKKELIEATAKANAFINGKIKKLLGYEKQV